MRSCRRLSLLSRSDPMADNGNIATIEDNEKIAFGKWAAYTSGMKTKSKKCKGCGGKHTGTCA